MNSKFYGRGRRYEQDQKISRVPKLRSLQPWVLEELFSAAIHAFTYADDACGKGIGKGARLPLGISATQVSKVLRGNENVTIETMAKFADALGAAVHIHVAKKGVRVEWREVPSGTEKPPERDYEGLIRVPDSDDLDQWGWEWDGSPDGLRSRRG